MKPLATRFPEKQRMQIADLSDITSASLSDIARAALQIGLTEINACVAINVEKAQEVIAINSLKSK